MHPHRSHKGYLFGGDVVAQFNSTNAVELIARAHQLVMEGYKHMFNDTLVTVWSAPNYCYRCGNVAAILELDEHLTKNFKIFEAAPQEVCVNMLRLLDLSPHAPTPRTCVPLAVLRLVSSIHFVLHFQAALSAGFTLYHPHLS